MVWLIIEHRSSAYGTVIQVDDRKRTNKYKTPASSTYTQSDIQNENPTEYHRQIQGYRPPREDAPKKRSSRLLIVVIVIVSLVFLYAAVQLGIYLVQSYHAKQEERMMREMIAQSETALIDDPASFPSDAATPAPFPSATEIPAEQTAPSIVTQQKPEVLIQFHKPLSVNPDTVGQLKMGESIYTYVVQRDNSYYLRHSFSGEYSISGAIFLDVTCSIYPQSRNLILHGHNMQDGTAFGKLSRFDSISYLNQYPFITFSTLYETSLYIPFAVVYYSINPKSDLYLDLYQVNVMSDASFLQFVQKVQLMSEYHLPVNLSAADQILTVTTCATADEDIRFAVFAVKRNME